MKLVKPLATSLSRDLIVTVSPLSNSPSKLIIPADRRLLPFLRAKLAPLSIFISPDGFILPEIQLLRALRFLF